MSGLGRYHMKKCVIATAALAASLVLAGSASAAPHHPGWNHHRMHHPVCHWEMHHHHKVRVCR